MRDNIGLVKNTMACEIIVPPDSRMTPLSKKVVNFSFSHI